MASGIEVPIVSTFNGKGITEARSELRRLESQAGSAGGVMGGRGRGERGSGGREGRKKAEI